MAILVKDDNVASSLKSLTIPSLVLVGIAGALFPDIDILWQGHRGWTHNWLLPVGILSILAVAYLGRQVWTRILKWKR